MARLRMRFVKVLTLAVACCIISFAVLGQDKRELVARYGNLYPRILFDDGAAKRHIPIMNGPHRNLTAFDGSWNVSAMAKPFHPHYDVNCSALIHRDKDVISKTNTMLENLRKTSGIIIPSDSNVTSMVMNCERFKIQRAYPRFVRSKEELDYPIAYTLLAHKTAAQVERLLRAIYQPQNVYCIHPDAKSSPDFLAAVFSIANCFPNVFIPSKLERIQYRGVTRLQADINCMKELMSHPVQWKYVINLCAQDFPLKTNLEIVQQLKAFKGMNEIESVIPSPGQATRTKYKFEFHSGYQMPSNTGIANSPPPHNMTIYFGNAYGAFVRSFVEFLINDQEAIDLLKWMEYTWSPDENYWATLHQHPRATPVWRNGTVNRRLNRLMRWGDIADHPPCEGKYVRALCVFGVGYLYHLTEAPHLFANKFHYDYDPICLQCLEQLLDYRANFPQTLPEFVKIFPVPSD